MICPNCKAQIENNIKYCNYCGKKQDTNDHSEQYNYSKQYSEVSKEYDENHEKQYHYSKSYSSVEKDYSAPHNNQYDYSAMYSNMTTINDEDYLRAFMGNNYETIAKGNFSKSAFILGSFYLIIKKMLVHGLLLFLFLGIIYYYNANIGFIITILVHLILGFKFNTMYYEFAVKKIDEIRLSNPDKSQDELLNICKKKGNKTELAAITMIIVTVIILVIIGLNYEVEEEEITSKEQTIQELSYLLPDNYEHGKYNNDTYRHYYYIEDNNSCTITILTYKNKNLNNYIKNNFREEKKLEEEINHTTWTHFEVTSDTWSQDNYITEKNNIIYHISFEKDENSNCKNTENEFINSLILK